ncbi:MAG: FGGY family carbohydrate kinase, partial [Nevskia sp.]|nr:FGGY family carbohydrate kinase [Nevskia sp.]
MSVNQKMPVLLAIDQGTTSSRAILFDRSGNVLGRAQRELPQSFPQPGWVEHDAERIWQDVRACVSQVLAEQGLSARDITALGITNQRETTVLWERASGRPLHPAIVWQDRRTAEFCLSQADAARQLGLHARTGLLL